MGTSTENASVEQQLLSFLEERTKTPWTPDRDLFADGGLSSLFAMELVVHLESAFDIVVAGPDLQLMNFRTVNAMVAMVDRLRQADSE